MNELIRFLSAQGVLLRDKPKGIDDQRILEFYQQMVLVRLYDSKAIALQRTGQLGTYPSHMGAEAIGIGTGYAMATDDVLVPYYRDMPVQWVRGVPMESNLLYWGGDERGSDFPSSSKDLPFCVPIATQCTHAVGVAAAIKIREQRRAVVVNLGDGATSKGDFTESINCAGVWQLPLVFVINNNQWAISVPRRLQSAAKHLADKALGAGIPAMRVDGNDVLAVYSSVHDALSRAYHGLGATVIEMDSYRLSDHTTADDASRYRDEEEYQHALRNEPLIRLKHYLVSVGLWTEQRDETWYKQCQQQVEQAVQRYQSVNSQAPESCLDYLYSVLPPELEADRDRLITKAMRMEADRDQ
ncbi:pyruvate dehydrogenase (acetyl-transferring) E1 component subunit alpha [Thaumasiovibrio sp. DFM-14]|uniref:pyruvate dehydrogenase (acetyl-transferring) E1 component subunit alpha n=1 Tax=Thaumasiovibrio sp. DFM-14 TaxID=3384792 RepID=UPI0039A2A406